MMTRDQIQTVLDALEYIKLHVPFSDEDGTMYSESAITICEAALAEPSEPHAWSEAAIDEYLDGYSLCGDDGDYTPTDDEKFVIKDAIIGFMSETPETKKYPSIEDIQQAVARGWCSDRNLLKRMDSDLATDIADQVAALLFTHPASSNHLDEISKVLHYPDCWDTATYPTLEDAIIEAKSWAHCTNEDCQCPTKEAP